MFLRFGQSDIGSPGANKEVRLIELTAENGAELRDTGKQVTLRESGCAGA
jgi:hypothetical protein